MIAHRGNVEGRNPDKENTVDYIKAARKKGYQVEIDVWYLNDKNSFYLGHDGPQQVLEQCTFENWDYSFFWLHCKNIEAYVRLLHKNPFYFGQDNVNAFYHEGKEPSVLTTKGYLWSIHKDHHDGVKGVAVLPEVFDFGPEPQKRFLDVCSDDLVKWSQSHP